jgi:hypothetical protein
MSNTTDLLGRPLDATERAVLAVHEQLTQLAQRGDLAPCVRANTLAALACTWQMANDLNLRVGELPE